MPLRLGRTKNKLKWVNGSGLLSGGGLVAAFPIVGT